jgi:hypothetical protein
MSGTAVVDGARAGWLLDEAGDQLGRHPRLVAEGDDHSVHVTLLGEKLDPPSQRGGLAVLPLLADDRLRAHEVHPSQDLLGMCSEHDRDRIELGDRALRGNGVIEQGAPVELGEHLRLLAEPGAGAGGQDQAADQAGTSWIRPLLSASRPPSRP